MSCDLAKWQYLAHPAPEVQLRNTANDAELHVVLKHYASLADSFTMNIALLPSVLEFCELLFALTIIPLSKVCPHNIMKCNAKADKPAEFKAHGKYDS